MPIQFQKAAPYITAPEFPLRDFSYRDKDGVVKVKILPTSYRQRINLSAVSAPSAFETRLTEDYGCEVWNLEEEHTFPNKTTIKHHQRKVKLNASLYVDTPADVAACLKFFVKDTHPIFGADPYGTGSLEHTTNQKQTFRYHADRHHHLGDPESFNFNEEERSLYLSKIGGRDRLTFHSIGFTANEVLDAATRKYGNVEIKFKHRSIKVILNFHIVPTPVSKGASRKEDVLEKILDFRSFALGVRSSLKGFFEGGDFKISIYDISRDAPLVLPVVPEPNVPAPAAAGCGAPAVLFFKPSENYWAAFGEDDSSDDAKPGTGK